MSTFGVDKVLSLLRNSEQAARFEQDPAAFLAGHELTPEEARALAARDLRALDRLGANGYLLLAFAHHAGVHRYQQLCAVLAEEPAGAPKGG
jgi:hypothetical protein